MNLSRNSSRELRNFYTLLNFLFFFIHFKNRLKTQLLIRCLVRLVAKGNEKPQAFAPFDTTIWIHDERVRYLAIRFDLVRFLPLISDSLCSESGVDLPLTGKWWRRRRRRAGSLFIKYVFINQNDPFNTPSFFRNHRFTILASTRIDGRLLTHRSDRSDRYAPPDLIGISESEIWHRGRIFPSERAKTRFTKRT